MIDLRTGDCFEVLKTLPDNSVDSIVTDPPYGISFMGKHWDHGVPASDVWAECLRVLKEGGHLLAFAGTRTQHRMATNIEDAGFEIRDMIAWVYGSGFPKSHNISKAIHKAEGTEDEAKQWEGWGSALKPSLEPITVARKPFKGTIADNVLKHGTGAINIDGCRIEHDEPEKTTKRTGRGNASVMNNETVGFDNEKNNSASADQKGRFPSNLIHDGSEEVERLFPNTGKSSGGSGEKSMGALGKNGKYGKYSLDVKADNLGGLGDNGSAARYFYCAKASKEDRSEGLSSLPNKPTAAAEFRPNHLEKSEQGEDGNPYGRWTPRKNIHPTVKPTDLMRYLVRLVTPPEGMVLDPFMGSGSTGKAAMLEGFNFTGIDIDPEYVELAKARIEYAQKMGNQKTMF